VGVLKGVNLVLTWAHGPIFPPQGSLREIGTCEFLPPRKPLRSCVIRRGSVDFSYSFQQKRVLESEGEGIEYPGGARTTGIPYGNPK
jgi:hypothetical protein